MFGSILFNTVFKSTVAGENAPDSALYTDYIVYRGGFNFSNVYCSLGSLCVLCGYIV